MPSALSRDTNARASVVSANSLSGTTGALAPLARTPPLAWFIVTSIFGSPRALRDHAVSARSPQGRSIAARILSDNHLTPMAALSGAPLLLWLGSGSALRRPLGITIRRRLLLSQPCRAFDQFPPTSPSVGCPFGQRTFAGANQRAGCADYRRSSATLALRIRSTAAISSPARTLALFDYIVGAHEQRSRRTRWCGYEA